MVVDTEAYDGYAYVYFPPGTVDVVHHDLRRLVGGAAFATQLTGTLTPEQMTTDLVVEWDDPVAFRRTFYSHQAAATEAQNRGGWTALFVLFVLLLLAGRVRAVPGETWQEAKRNWRAAFRRRLPFVIGAALLAGALVGWIHFASLDRTEARLVGRSFHDHRHAQRTLEIPTGDVEAVRAAARDYWADAENPYQSGGVREEDSPGNYVVRERDGRVEYAYYDARGKEFVRTAADGD
jgi:hypothetical protein